MRLRVTLRELGLKDSLEARPATAKGTLTQLKVPAEKKEDEEKQSEEAVGLIARNRGESFTLSTNEQKSGALIIILNDLEPHAVIVGDGASAGEAVGVEAAGDMAP